MQKNGSNRVYSWTERDFRVSVAKYTHYPVSNISTFPGQMICNTVTTLHELWQEDGLVGKFCNKITTKSDYRTISNLIRTLFTVSEGLKNQMRIRSRADYIRSRELDFGKMIEPLYVP